MIDFKPAGVTRLDRPFKATLRGRVSMIDQSRERFVLQPVQGVETRADFKGMDQASFQSIFQAFQGYHNNQFLKLIGQVEFTNTGLPHVVQSIDRACLVDDRDPGLMLDRYYYLRRDWFIDEQGKKLPRAQIDRVIELLDNAQACDLCAPVMRMTHYDKLRLEWQISPSHPEQSIRRLVLVINLTQQNAMFDDGSGVTHRLSLQETSSADQLHDLIHRNKDDDSMRCIIGDPFSPSFGKKLIK